MPPEAFAVPEPPMASAWPAMSTSVLNVSPVFGAMRMVTPAVAREGYLARFNAFMDAHRELFRSLEMTHCVVRADENPWRALALFLAERKRLK